MEAVQEIVRSHAHHWVIDEPQGLISVGTCRVCGAERKFKNWLADADYITRSERQEVSLSA